MNEGVKCLRVRSLSTTRDFIDVRDVGCALMKVAARGEPDFVYNVGSGIETPIQHVLECLLESSGRRGQSTLEAVPCRASDVPRHCANVTRLCALGFQCRYTLEETLASILAYYRDLK